MTTIDLTPPPFLDRRGQKPRKVRQFSPATIEARDIRRTAKFCREAWERFRRKEARRKRQSRKSQKPKARKS